MLITSCMLAYSIMATRSPKEKVTLSKLIELCRQKNKRQRRSWKVSAVMEHKEGVFCKRKMIVCLQLGVNAEKTKSFKLHGSSHQGWNQKIKFGRLRCRKEFTLISGTFSMHFKLL